MINKKKTVYDSINFYRLSYRSGNKNFYLM